MTMKTMIMRWGAALAGRRFGVLAGAIGLGLAAVFPAAAAIPSGPPVAPLYVTNRTAAALAAALGVTTNGGIYVGDGSGLTNLTLPAFGTNLTVAGTLTNNISGSAAYATNAGTATNVPWSALPGPVLTNAAAFQPASSNLSNLANNNGSLLTNLNADAISGTFAGSFSFPSGFSNTLAECAGNGGYNTLCGGGFAQYMTNNFTFTNLQAVVGGATSATQAYFFLFSLPSFATAFNPWHTTALYSNTVALPAYTPGVVTSFYVPPVQATAGNFLVAVWIPTSLANGAVKFAYWQGDAGNTNLPRVQMPYYYTAANNVQFGTYPIYGSAGMILSGYGSQAVTNFTTYLASLSAASGGGGGGGATNASQLLYNNAVSGLSGGSVQSAIDQLAGEAQAGAAYVASLGVQVPRVILADSYTAVAGDDLQMFVRGMIEAENPYNLPYQVTCSKGSAYPRYFDYSAVSADASLSPLTLTVSVTDLAGQTVIASGSTMIDVVTANHGPGSNIVVACIGDSLTDAGIWPTECYRRLTQAGGTPAGKGWGNIQFVGDRPMTSYPGQGFSGWGGWQWATYTNSSTSSAAWLNAPGHDKTATDIGSYWYDSASNKWRIMAIAGSTLKLGYNGGAISTLGSSGTLTYDSADGGGTHTSSIAYTSASPTILSPINNTNGFSFAGFSTLVGATNLNVVYVLLGWNGLPGPNYAYASNHVAFQNAAQAFINQLRTDFPQALVRIVGMEVPSPNGGLAANYGATGTYSQYYPLLRTLNGVRLAYQQLCDLPANSSFCRFVDIAPQFDSENNMQAATAPVNSRNSATEVRGTNGVHPGTDGYYQIADAIYRDFVRTFCQ